jgi:hypothetical protein
MTQGRNILRIIFSLILTPLILFITTSNSLYLANQADLGNDFTVLLPFACLFIASLIIGFILYRYSKYKAVGYILWFYYLVGPFYLVYTFLRNVPVQFLETSTGVILGLALLSVILIVLILKIQLRSMATFFAFFGPLLLLVEAYLFFTQYGSTPQFISDVSKIDRHITDSRSTLPNIYLLVLDEYQTEMFDLTLSDEVKKSLGGFIYFHENASHFGTTEMSLSSMFSLKSYKFGVDQLAYRKDSFGSQSSILYWLKDAGYNTHAYIRGSNERPLNVDLFDSVMTFKKNENFIMSKYSFKAFRDLWIYSSLPSCIAVRILKHSRFGRILATSYLPQCANIGSLNLFFRYLREEKSLSSNNRFTYIYSLIPHEPYIFDEDCSFSDELSETSPIAQSMCATMLIMKFVETLKELNRYDNSLIIVCADHGAYFECKDGGLTSLKKLGRYDPRRNMPRSKALLLVKPHGKSCINEFTVSDFPSSLIDIAPTIASSLNSGITINYDGISLTDPLPAIQMRKRYYYYYYRIKGPFRLTDEMTRYIIDNNQIQIDTTVKMERK